MTTSNSTNFSVTANDIITDAYILLEALGIGETLSGDDYVLGLRWLNYMVKTWQAQGLHLWTETEGAIVAIPDQASYKLGGTSPDRSTSTLIRTELSVAAVATDTTLTIDSSAGMTVGDAIGIELDDVTIEWTTIATIPDSTSVTITDALVGTAAAIDNKIFVYTTTMVRPIEISSVRYQQDDGNERVVRRISREEYFNLPNKTTSGTPNSYYFDRQRDHGRMYVYPVPDVANSNFNITFSRQLEDFDASTDTPDFPVEWSETLIFNLAVKLSGPLQRLDKGVTISPLASEMLQGLKGWDSEQASFKVR